MSKNTIVIGGGFSGLSAATHLAHAGKKVILLEKNNTTGGRCRSWEKDGFKFDMGPSWYWMPDVFEKYFSYFGKNVSDYYSLVRLDPSYKVFHSQHDQFDIPATMPEIETFFESIEKGSSVHLRKILTEAEYKYKASMDDLVYRPGKSSLEFVNRKVLSSLFKIDLFTSVSKHIGKKIKHPYLRQLLEFPVLFLGAKPENTPALYTLMNYADMVLGTWYPMGGMTKITEAMTSLAQEKGVEIHCNEEVNKIEIRNNNIHLVNTAKECYQVNGVVAGSDYAHTESLLPEQFRNYTESYWNKRTLAPSSLLFFIGVSKKLKNIRHHNLFFDTSFAQHANEIYNTHQWPEQPLFYVCASSITDSSVAPQGMENLFFLVPLSTRIEDTEDARENIFSKIVERFENLTGNLIRDHIVVKRSYCKNDFISDYHSLHGNAYGLANTLKQTAFLKPKIYNKKLKNLIYTGQLTVPGPGVPPAIISGQLAANEILNLKNRTYETVV